MKAIRILLNSVIDYAGLFPPAGLDMETAVREYAACRNGELSWALGRFIVPVSRLEELETGAAELPLRSRTGEPWRASNPPGS